MEEPKFRRSHPQVLPTCAATGGYIYVAGKSHVPASEIAISPPPRGAPRGGPQGCKHGCTMLFFGMCDFSGMSILGKIAHFYTKTASSPSPKGKRSHIPHRNGQLLRMLPNAGEFLLRAVGDLIHEKRNTVRISWPLNGAAFGAVCRSKNEGPFDRNVGFCKN